MDKVRSLSLESLNYQSFKAQYVLKITQFLVSVSVCSFLFSPSSLFAFSLQLFTHTIDKNCMFLLCNGLLVFVGIARSFSGSSGSDDEVSSSSSKYVDDGSSSEYSDIEAREPLLEVEAEERSREPDELNIPSDEAVEIKYYEGDEDMEIKAIVEYDVEQQEGEELRTSHLILEDEETGMLDAGEEEGSKGHDFLIEEGIEEEEIEYEEEEDDDAENSRLSTEELNKKFDDFIRRMREDLRIEARRQLIMV
ncbi:hypothetical protein K1719_013425 [Acacia pycnantha]|nr:hypothetical protein K1719_013425 [Acacia pycnantha]